MTNAFADIFLSLFLSISSPSLSLILSLSISLSLSHLKYTSLSQGQYVLRVSVSEPGLNTTFFNDTSFGYLVTQNDDLPAYKAARHGSPVSQAGTLSWTGDIGGVSGSGGSMRDWNTTGSYFHRFASVVTEGVGFDLGRAIAVNVSASSAGSNLSKVSSGGNFSSVRFVNKVFPFSSGSLKFREGAMMT